MLITQIKSKEELDVLTQGKVFMINCHGCREIAFPEKESIELQKELAEAGKLTGVMTTEYICNPSQLTLQMKAYLNEIEEADAVLVLSCGVGVQTTAELLPDKKVLAACDTIRLPGFQGVTPLEYDCGQCGECYLNLTGGICPITACSKSLVNGPCGGTKNGKCEVDPSMDCGWEKIYRKLESMGRLDVLKAPVQVRNYSTDDVTKAWKEA